MNKARSQPLPQPRYMGLDFRFADLQSEVTNFAQVSQRYLEKESREVFNDWLTDLVSFRDSRRPGLWRWAISPANPIKTTKTLEYEPGDRRGGISVHGELTCVWEIELKAEGNGKNKGKSAGQVVCLNGIASTLIKIIRTDAELRPVTIAQWQFEVGDSQSPGCHFHVGIGHFGTEAAALPVPRLPSILLTPIDALDFLLGEIFQQKWKQEVNRETSQMQLWSEKQRTRLSNLLKWKQDQIDQSGGSAWNYLKHQRPTAQILLT
jgi:hypothetical protein